MKIFYNYVIFYIFLIINYRNISDFDNYCWAIYVMGMNNEKEQCSDQLVRV